MQDRAVALNILEGWQTCGTVGFRQVDPRPQGGGLRRSEQKSYVLTVRAEADLRERGLGRAPDGQGVDQRYFEDLHDGASTLRNTTLLAEAA